MIGWPGWRKPLWLKYYNFTRNQKELNNAKGQRQKTSTPYARVAAMTSIKTNTIETPIKLPFSTLETLLKLTLNTHETYLQLTLNTPDTHLKLTLKNLKRNFKHP